MMKAKSACCLLGAVSIALLAAAPAWAQSDCSESCSPDIGCYGGCEISAAAPCGAACWSDGCGATCQAYGKLSCKFTVTIHCQQQPPTDNPPPTGWAVIRYEQPSTAPLDPRDVAIVSTSSDAIARYAQEDTARQENRAMLDRAAADSSGALPLGEMVAFVVVPSSRCVHLRSKLAVRTMPDERPEKPETIYFRASTDGSGRIASAEVLYTDAGDPVGKRLLTFAKENLRAWSPEKPGLPLQLYGTLRVLETGSVETAALAGSLLF